MDVLAALDQLEIEDKAKAPRSQSRSKSREPQSLAARNAAKNAGTKPPSRRASGASNKQPVSIPPPEAPRLTIRAPTGDPRGNFDANIDASSGRSPSLGRSPSVGGASSRRISFAAAPEAAPNRLWIPTKGDSLATGFVYDPRLFKYNVSEKEWEDFSDQVVEAANVPGPSWLWKAKKKGVMTRINRDLQYNGDVHKVFKKWNRLFKQQRFQAWLELPGQKSDDLLGNSKDEKVDVGRFRVVVTPNSERAPSVYSRSSSLTRSVSGEGAAAAKMHKEANAEMNSSAARDGDEDD